MERLESLADWIVANPRVVVAGILLVTAVLGLGVPQVTVETSFQEYVGGTTSSQANEYVDRNFRTGRENVTTAYLLVEREYHVVAVRDMLEQLRFQRRVVNDSRITSTLAEGQPSTGFTNTIMFVYIQRAEGRPRAAIDPLPEPENRPSYGTQYRVLNESNWRHVKENESLAVRRLNEGFEGPLGNVYAYVPHTYDATYGSGGGPRVGRAKETVIYVHQRQGLTDDELLRSQTAMRDVANEEFRQTAETDIRVYGAGIVNDELDRSTTDSLLLVGPLALLLVLAVLLYAFRDPLDVVLALFGVVVVQVWTFGTMGWAGIELNQVFVSIPIFLVGLSIDYALHAVMRYREERELGDRYDPRVVFLGEDPDPGIRPAMSAGIAGVGSAFLLVTFTTATGFLAGVTSPVRAIREFGLVAAVGITAALVVFTALIPALKLVLDERLEARGHDRRRRPFATGEGRLNGVLERSVRVAETAPWTVVALALVLTTAGLVGATTVDTSFGRQEFTVEDPPEWMDTLPEPFRPGNYTTAGSLRSLRENGFVNRDNTVHVLVRGNVTDPAVLEGMNRSYHRAQQSNATLTFGRHETRKLDAGASPVEFPRGNPVLFMQTVAETNETFNETFSAADTDGDGIPDRNVEAVYDALYETKPEAAESVVYRENGEYRALRMGLYTNGSQPTQFVASEGHESAAMVDRVDGVSATATGRPVIRAAVQQQLFTTIQRSFALTLVVVLVLLTLIYRVYRNSATLGVVTMLPVLFAVAWILGTMAALDIPFNVLTALITSFTIGIGVDYSIHVSERYLQELERQGSVSDALRTSVFGTGGALLGSAITDISGFGVLVFAIVGPLQQFGVIAAVTIAYSFVGGVVVLPCLLVLWTQHFHTAEVPRAVASPAPLDWRPRWW